LGTAAVVLLAAALYVLVRAPRRGDSLGSHDSGADRAAVSD